MRDTFQHERLTFTFRIERDEDTGAPWDEHDGHGPVSDWQSSYNGQPVMKRPGQMVLIHDRGSYRLYDFAAAVAMAKRDGWNAKPYDVPGETRGQRAHKAAMADFRRLAEWCNDQWEWVGVIVTCADLPGAPSESIWGIESDAGEYLEEVARELAGQIIDSVASEVERAVA
jgi:hypothetical protein